MNFNAVVFDLDGTLYDKSRLSLRLVATQLFRGRLGVLGRERKLRKKMKGQFFGSEAAFNDAFFDALGGEKAKGWYYDIFMPTMARLMKKHYHLNSWVQPLMQSLRQEGIKIAVFSDYPCTEKRLEALGFDLNWVDGVFDAPSFGGLKPCKEAFEAVCRALGERPEDCVMVGDREDTDGVGAAQVGMKFVLVKGQERPVLE